MATKTHRTVVRNAAYRSGEFNVRERHNERKNESYHNGDIDPSRADMNIHFKRNYAPDGSVETYEQTFNRLIDEGVIVQKGQRKDGTAKVFDELVLDVNTAYFEDNGGYDYAKSFFEEAYRCAVNEVGGEQYILSAVLHADERNKALSEEHGRDIYHYHLHVVYVPIVQKEVLWSKRTKDKSLIGKVKEVIPQISHSKKWPMRVPVERDCKMVMLNAYSLLQDRFFDHMRAAGFEGFERGERGSNREHLSDLEYKTMKESERLAGKKSKVAEADEFIANADEKINARKETYTDLGKKISGREKQLATLDKKLSIRQKAAEKIDMVNSIGKKNLMGQIVVAPDELQSFKKIIRSEAKTKDENHELSKRNAVLFQENTRLKTRLEGFEGKGINDQMEYYKARQRAPRRMADTVADIMRQPPEQPVQKEQERQHIRNQQNNKSQQEGR
jgi:hypothetical protein